MPPPPLTLTFDRLTLKLVLKSHLGNLPSKFGHARPLEWILELFVVRDGRTDGRAKATLIAPFPTVGA